MIMRTTYRFFVLLTVLTSFSLGQDQQAEEYQKAISEMTKAFQQMNQATANAPEPIDFRELKKALPETLLGMKRTSAKGEKNAAMGIKMSQATGEYADGNGMTARVELTDPGSLSGIVGMSLAGWSMMEVDRESDEEMEQTFTFKGHKAHKTYYFPSRRGELHLLLSERMILGIELEQIPLEKLETALNEFDFDFLISLAKPTE
jgi:hypothetical protein